jgi:hypothetical protein
LLNENVSPEFELEPVEVLLCAILQGVSPSGSGVHAGFGNDGMAALVDKKPEEIEKNWLTIWIVDCDKPVHGTAVIGPRYNSICA